MCHGVSQASPLQMIKANAQRERWLHLFGQISIRDKCFGLSG